MELKLEQELEPAPGQTVSWNLGWRQQCWGWSERRDPPGQILQHALALGVGAPGGVLGDVARGVNLQVENR